MHTPAHRLPTPDKKLQQLTNDTAYHMVILTSPLQLKQFHGDLEHTELCCTTSTTEGLRTRSSVVTVTSLLLTNFCALQPCITNHTLISAPTLFRI